MKNTLSQRYTNESTKNIRKGRPCGSPNNKKKSEATNNPGHSGHPLSVASEFEQPLELLLVETDYYLLASYDDDGRGHRPHPLQLGKHRLVFGYIPSGELHAILTEELLRLCAEHSAGLHEQNDVFSNRHRAPLGSS